MNTDLYIVEDLEELAEFRSRKAEEYPEDVRNRNAAVYCQALADAIRALGPDHPVIQRYHAVKDHFLDQRYEDARCTWWQEREIGGFSKTGFTRGETKTVVSENEAVDYVMDEISDLESAITEWEVELREEAA